MKICNEILQGIYNLWTESEKYKDQSALENGTYDQQREEIIKVVGKEADHEICDFYTDAACESERAGFESGFRYGMLFASGMLDCK